MKVLPTQERLKELFDYNPTTGVLPRRTSVCSYAAGSCVGTSHSSGYLRVTIDRKQYYLHRVIWKLITGGEPGGLDIDHINRDRSDNRLSNLRLVDRSTNKLNHGGYKSNKNGANGVHFVPSSGKWRAQRRKGGVAYHLGYFDSLTEAAAVSRAWDAR